MPDNVYPAEDLETQLRKIADGLLSGRYSYPDSDVVTSEYSTELPHQKGVTPGMLKALVGKGHEEFCTMRQQDAFELLLHLLKLITRSQHPDGMRDPVSDFRFVLEQRLECVNCRKVRYRTDVQDNISVPVPARRIKKISAEEGKETKDVFEPITIKECLDIFTAKEAVEFTCPHCGKGVATKYVLYQLVQPNANNPIDAFFLRHFLKYLLLIAGALSSSIGFQPNWTSQSWSEMSHS